MKSRAFLLRITSLVIVVLLMAATGFAASVPRMSTDELSSRLSEDGVVVLDVRSPYHWGSTDKKILGAERVVPGAFADWAGNYGKQQTIVLYCA